MKISIEFKDNYVRTYDKVEVREFWDACSPAILYFKAQGKHYYYPLDNVIHIEIDDNAKGD